MPDANTPDNYWAPLINLGAPLAAIAAQSDDIKHAAENFGLGWAMPYAGTVAVAVGALAGLNWFYRRAIGRGSRPALWFRDLMPWNRSR